MQSAPRLSIVLLSYHRPQPLRQALASFGPDRSSIFELIVVDNRSDKSDEIRKVVAEFPFARLKALAENQGFAAGMNQGINEATGDLILISEDDIAFEPGALKKLISFQSEQRGCVMTGPVIINLGDRRIRFAGGDLDLRFRYDKKLYHQGEALGSQLPRVRKVSYLCGAVMISQRTTWEKFRGFHPDFFMYFEDDELSQRILKAGGELLVFSESVVTHVDPQVRPDNDWMTKKKFQNLLRLLFLHSPALHLPLTLARHLWKGPRSVWFRLVSAVELVRDFPRLWQQRHIERWP